MLFTRRASQLSASDAPRRVCDEVATSVPRWVEHHIQRSSSSRYATLLSTPREMHITPPRPEPAPSPTSTCRWKRGRPVMAGSPSMRRMHHMPGPNARSPLNQATANEAATTTEDKGRPLQTSAALHRVGLWKPSYGLRFATTAPVETSPSVPTPIDKKPLPRPDARPSESPHTEHEFKCAGDIGADTSPGAGDGTYAAESQSSYGVDSSENSICADVDDAPSQDETESGVSEDDKADTHTALAYQIPEDTLRAAMLASPQTRASYWSAKLYQGPEGEALSTHYCKSFEVAERVAQYFLKEKVVGFDIEWKPFGHPRAIKQNTSLIQLACEDRIALFHVALFSGNKAEQLMPPSLKAVLESPDIIKVGVAIKGDFKRVEKYLRVQPQGVFELSRLHNLVEWYEADPKKVTNRLVSLATQVLQHLQLPLYKGEQLEDDPDTTCSVRESDWSLPLNLQQIHYAAADAYAGFRLYHILEWKRSRLTPAPPPIPLCDYDNKPTPRSNPPRKRAKPTTKTDIVVDNDANLSATEQGQESDGDAEGYETAPEELMDSHELEDPVSGQKPGVSGDVEDETLLARSEEDAALRGPSDQAFADEASPSSRRIGRIRLQSLQSDDVGYPKLPQSSQEEGKGSLSSQPADEIDEYPDPELEEALGHMTLDDSGSLREDVKNLGCEKIEEPVHANAADLPDFKPAFFDVLPVDDPSPPETMSTMDSCREPSNVPVFDLATTWAQNHLRSTIPSPASTVPSRLRATTSHLRAYCLWHHQKLSVDEIAPLLRDPPFSHSTVTNYILQAVTLERLDFEPDSLKRLMMAMPSGMRNGRWKGLAEKVGVLG